MASLIVVSNRLPVTVGETIEKSSGGMVSALEGLGERDGFRWIGWAGGTVEDPDRKWEIVDELEERFRYTPLFLTREEADDYYTGFSNASLWPLLHYLPTNARYRERWFETYRAVNRKFADAVLETSGTGDTVWIQDYHLMLLPAMIRRERPEMKVGYFLHTPFPSYELFRCHPDREALLRGLLGADRVGFHTSGDRRHFHSSVQRLLGIESDGNDIRANGRRTAVGVHPIGANAQKFLETLETEAFSAASREVRRTYEGKKIVLGVERLDYTKGLLHRLEAIDRFLRRSGRTDVVFVFVNVPSRESVPEYKDLLEGVERKIGAINGRYSNIGHIPVHFLHRSVAFEELCALYAVSDVAAVTPLRDGMNLVAKEYVLCRREKAGALILSEFSGAAEELVTAYQVNPYNVSEVAQALEDVLEAGEEEKRRRLEPMRRRVEQYDARFWAESFLDALAAGERIR